MYRIRRSALLRDLELAEFLLAGVAGAVRRSAGGSSLVVGTVLVCFIVGVVERIDKSIGIDLETSIQPVALKQLREGTGMGGRANLANLERGSERTGN